VLRDDEEILFEWRGPAFRFPAALPPAAAGGAGAELVVIDEGNSELLSSAFAWFRSQLRERQPCIAAAKGGRAISVCYTARGFGGPSLEAGVETLAEHRGCGHGARVVAAWAHAVRAAGHHPLYSTSWENRASRALADRLGLVAYGEDLHFT
jgi:hypothetical protein